MNLVLISKRLAAKKIGEGGKLHCCSLTKSSSVKFCGTSTGKACCTTTVAKTTQLFNGWVPKPKLHLQITNKTLGNWKKEAKELWGWQALSLLLASDRKSSFKSPSLFFLPSLRETPTYKVLLLFVLKNGRFLLLK